MLCDTSEFYLQLGSIVNDAVLRRAILGLVFSEWLVLLRATGPTMVIFRIKMVFDSCCPCGQVVYDL